MIMRKTILSTLLLISCAVLGSSPIAAASLIPGDPIVLEKTSGKFDFIRIDTGKGRLLLAHTGNKSLDIFDLKARRLSKSVATGAAQDVAIDSKNSRYFVAVSAPPRMAIVDAVKLEMTGEVSLPAAADLATFNASNGKVYVCNDTAPELWVIDPGEKKITATITLPGSGMEDLAFDSQFKKLFQVVKGNNTLVVIDPANNKPAQSWSTAPATNPHGMALIPDTDLALVAGGGGKLALLNLSTGKLLASADIDNRVDEIAYDPELHLAYCPGGGGNISVVRVEGDKLTLVENVAGASGRSVVVDPKTHTVWVAFNKGDQAFLQPFTPKQ
jgi:DNA-binding beta-propeller fold protein YncE